MKKPLVRGHWIAASQFHDLTEAEVLREVSKRVAETKARAGAQRQSHPLVLFDLDSTLYEVGPRTHQILREWLDSSESAEFPRVREELRGLENQHVGYSLKDTFEALGLDLERADVSDGIASAKKFWLARFFSDDYLKYDHAYPGAAHFVREVHRLGAEIVYLTGRDEPGMGRGTRDALLRDGFPRGCERTHLLLKAAFGLPDLEHKQSACNYVREHGSLIASFENEPVNLVAIYEIFPEAMHVLVETVSSEHAALPVQGLYRIRGFQHL